MKRSKKGTDIQRVISRKRLPVHRRSLVWMLAAGILLLMGWILPDAFFERYYYGGFFKVIRIAYDYTLGWLPVPMIYIVAGIVLLRTVRWVKDMSKGFLHQFSRLAGGIAAVIFCFYAFWGFNYHQVSLQDRLGFNLGAVSISDMEEEFYRATRVLQEEAKKLPVELKNDEAIISRKVTDHHVRDEVKLALQELDVPSTGRVRVRQLWPNGLLLRWSTAGIYIPHAWEGHIDKGLLSVQKPFTIAHEMTHGYGITDEGACNFVAWLACMRSEDPWLRFGGALTYWRYAAAEMPEAKVKEAIESFDPVIRRSITLIRENDNKYPDIMPYVRDLIYSTYLERHGVKGGLRSYNYVVVMVSQYLQKTSDDL